MNPAIKGALGLIALLIAFLLAILGKSIQSTWMELGVGLFLLTGIYLILSWLRQEFKIGKK